MFPPLEGRVAAEGPGVGAEEKAPVLSRSARMCTYPDAASLDAVAGALPGAIGANAEGTSLICPFAYGPEAAWAGADFDILAPRSLIAIANHFRGTQVLSRPEAGIHASARDLPDLADIKGQETAKRALEVAAAGGHNLLMVWLIKRRALIAN